MCLHVFISKRRIFHVWFVLFWAFWFLINMKKESNVQEHWSLAQLKQPLMIFGFQMNRQETSRHDGACHFHNSIDSKIQFHFYLFFGLNSTKVITNWSCDIFFFPFRFHLPKAVNVQQVQESTWTAVQPKWRNDWKRPARTEPNRNPTQGLKRSCCTNH